jgi:ribosomal protein L15|tara:strand:- start:770 stop:952 length:183 start_codon:yes stop_codon:yes gene_type:complete
MTKSRYKKYSQCNLDELEDIVSDLENMSIAALKGKKIDIRKSILGAVKEAKLVIEKRLKK